VAGAWIAAGRDDQSCSWPLGPLECSATPIYPYSRGQQATILSKALVTRRELQAVCDPAERTAHRNITPGIMGYFTVLQRGGEPQVLLCVKEVGANRNIMIKQDRPSFLSRTWTLKSFSVSLAAHTGLFLVYAGGFIYAIQDMIRDRREAGLIHCMFPKI
jgi:hypothetical protein